MKSDETENAPTIELTRRRALAGLATIGVGSAAAGAGTFAAFSDSESTTGGFSAGTLTLSMDGTSLNFNPGEIEPGDFGSSAVRLVPEGSLTGDLKPALTNVDSTTGENSTDSTGDLHKHLQFKIWLDEGRTDDGNYNSADIALLSNGTVDDSRDPSYATVQGYNGVSWADAINGMSSEWTFHVDWRLPEDTGNEAQGDSLDTTFKFTLE